MKKLLLILCLTFIGCNKPDSEAFVLENETKTTPKSRLINQNPYPNQYHWNFFNLSGWENASQGMGSVLNYSIVNFQGLGKLKIFTNPNTTDRPKIKTIQRFTIGEYSWKVYANQMGVGDRTSIGAFLYKSDDHELDFEIGYGTQIIRNQLNAVADDLIVYTTSQNYPFLSNQTKIKRNLWYNLSITLGLDSNDKYTAVWKINNLTVQSTTLGYGPADVDFSIYCSLENLNFIGDHTSTGINTTYFDWVSFVPELY
jgi:hypothetical protein